MSSLITMQFTEDDYWMLRSLLEHGYYSAKDGGYEEEMNIINELEGKFIDVQPK